MEELEQGLQVPWEHRWDSLGANQEGCRVEAAAALGSLGGAQALGRVSKQPRSQESRSAGLSEADPSPLAPGPAPGSAHWAQVP